ncbi:serine/threonine protein kinase, partial [Natroniella acetigena]|uniref:serine/threonine protein kinase n=1 Tax=Natroniella acetigena TaxID=52004 RepID=UPI00200B94DE
MSDKECIYCGQKIGQEKELCPICGLPQVQTKNLKVSTLIGDKYRIVKTLGQGGFGITYLVEEKESREKYAVKELFVGDACVRTSQSTMVGITKQDTFERSKDKFRDEMNLLRELNDDSLVKVYEIMEDNNTLYGVMEYIEGESLEDRIKSDYKYELDEFLELAKEISKGLNEFHKLGPGMIHRDISPDNIMVTKDGEYKLIDFGSVKELEDNQGNKTRFYKEGYSPIELNVSDYPLEFATDIYSLGMTFYAILARTQVPYGALDREKGAGVEAEYRRSVKNLKILDNGEEITLPEYLQQMILKMTELEMEDRYQSLDEVLAVLEDKSDSKIEEKKADIENIINDGVLKKFIDKHNGEYNHEDWLELKYWVEYNYGKVDEKVLGEELEREQTKWHNNLEKDTNKGKEKKAVKQNKKEKDKNKKDKNKKDKNKKDKNKKDKNKKDKNKK